MTLQKKPKESRKTRLNPSKLLVLMLYGTYPYMDSKEIEDGVREVKLAVGPFGRLLRVKNKNIIEYLEWLEEMNFLTIVGRDYYSITVLVEPPTLFRNPME